MQHKILSFLLSVTLLQVILAHLCVLDPPQRGPLSIKMPGDSNCYRPYAECGNQPSEAPKITWIAGYGIFFFLKIKINIFCTFFIILSAIWTKNIFRKAKNCYLN